jgi:hypothetical protein
MRADNFRVSRYTLTMINLSGSRHTPTEQGMRNFGALQQMNDVVHVGSYDCRGRLRYRNRDHVAIDNCGSL